MSYKLFMNNNLIAKIEYTFPCVSCAISFGRGTLKNSLSENSEKTHELLMRGVSSNGCGLSCHYCSFSSYFIQHVSKACTLHGATKHVPCILWYEKKSTFATGGLILSCQFALIANILKREHMLVYCQCQQCALSEY